MKDLLSILMNTKLIFSFVVTFTLYFGLAIDAYLNNNKDSSDRGSDSIFGYAPIIRVMTWYGFWAQVFLISFGPYVSFSSFVVFIFLFMAIVAILKNGITYVYKTFESVLNSKDLLTIFIISVIGAIFFFNLNMIIKSFLLNKSAQYATALLCAVVLSMNLLVSSKNN